MLSKLFLGQDSRDIRAAISQMIKHMSIALIVISSMITILLESTFEKWSDSPITYNPWPLAILFGVILFLVGSWVTVYLESKFQKIYRESDERVKNSKVQLSINRK